MTGRRVPLALALLAAALLATTVAIVAVRVLDDGRPLGDTTAAILVGGAVLAALLTAVAWRADHVHHRRARDAAQEVAAKLQRSFGRLHAGRGSLEDPSDTRMAVLQLAMQLVDADKGLLLTKHDRDHDGNLDVVAARGFDHDPEGTPVVQRLGGRVIERDQTLREDHPEDGGEIQNLVAIPIYIRDEFDGVVVCANRDGGFAEVDDDVLLALGNHASSVLGGTRVRGEQRAAYVATVRALADAIDAKDPGLRSHSEEVAQHVTAVARVLDLDGERREALLFGSLLHDVGKIGISERILLKPERLTADEFEAIKEHPRIGHRLVAGIPALAPIAPAILHHHERYDGTGYPAGLAGDDIPLEARLIGIADAYSAMTADRPYSRGMPSEDACAELERCAGSQFDPEAVSLFVDEVRRHPPSRDRSPVGDALAEHVVQRGGGPVGAPALALVDGLTGLYGRRHLHELLDARIRVAARHDEAFGVVLVELHDLAGINGREGFAAGDAAIQHVAGSLRAVEARTGATVCRVGGRRFALVVATAGEPAMAEVGDRATLALDGGPPCRLCGVMWRPGDTGEALLARAREGLPAPA